MNGIAITTRVKPMQGSPNNIKKEVAYTKKGWKLKKMSINCFMRIFSLNDLNKLVTLSWIKIRKSKKIMI